jgi:proline racemase
MTEWAERLNNWVPPESWRRLTTVDAHTAGEPLRIILAGFPELSGESVMEQRRFAKEWHEGLRRALMWEPRGHADMYGCLVVPPVSPRGDIGVLFMHNDGYSTMCGHGIIAVTTALLQTGVLPAHEPETLVRIDTPAGFVEAWASVRKGLVEEVSFINVRSFVSALEQEIEIPGLGTVRYDLAYGGAFYAYVDAEEFGFKLLPDEVDELIKVGRTIKDAVQTHNAPTHPLDPHLGFVYGTIFVGPAHDEGAHSRNVCVFADGEVDRSPTGTGLSGRLAIHYNRGEIHQKQEIVVESILGTTFKGRVLGEAPIGNLNGITPEVTGRAFVTGRNELMIDPRDPLADGFLIR